MAATAAVSTPMSAIAPVQRHRRVSYVLPAPTRPLSSLSLPPLDVNRRGRSGPAYIVRERPQTQHLPRSANQPSHLKHRLPVQTIALDLSTSVRSSSEDGQSAEPGGILYTGGRDGLVCSWELNLPTRKRKRRYGTFADDAPGSDSDDDERDRKIDDEEDDLAADLDLGPASPKVTSFHRSGMRHRSSSGRSRKDSSANFRSTRVKDFADDAWPPEDRWEIDVDRLSDNAATNQTTRSNFRQGLQSHTDWVNGIALVDHGKTLVSVSSDSLVLAWSPHASSHEEQVTPKQLGSHTDYVRCITASRDGGWVATGGFDRKIKVWDISEGRATAALELPSPPASVYSLATTHNGNIIACGSPERVVRVYDPRSRQQVARLNGHTDNVRSMLLSEDGQWLLSASSDSTVKLWSIAAQKCLHTFSHHSASVWSIFSQHPNLEIFYSGDKQGNICKVDLVGTGDPEEGECILLARDAADDNEPGDIPRGCEGITQLVAHDDAFVWAASGSSSVKRWRDVPPRNLRSAPMRSKVEIIDSSTTHLPRSDSMDVLSEMQNGSFEPSSSLRDGMPRVSSPSVSFLDGLTATLSRTTSSPSPRVNAIANAQAATKRPSSLKMRPSVLRSAQLSKGGNLVILPQSVTAGTSLFDIPYDSLVPLTLPQDPFFSPLFASRTKDPEIATIYSSVSALSGSQSAHRPLLSSSPPSHRPTSIAETIQSENQPVSMARRDFLERDSVNDCTPLRTSPDEVIEGEHGLTRCEILSDRRHVLTIDTDDKVALWDIINCDCLGVFEDVSDARRPSDAVSSVSGNGSSVSADNSIDLLEYVRDHIDGEAAIAPWCKCDARVGALTVHLDEARVWEGEVYADDIGYVDYPVDFRFILGKVVLRNLFNGFIEAELEHRQSQAGQAGGRPPLRLSLSNLATPSTPALRTSGMTIGLATPAPSRATLADAPSTRSPRPALWDLTPIPQSPGSPRFQESAAPGSPSATPVPNARNEQDYFSLPTAAPPSPTVATKSPESATAPLPTPGGTLMGRLKFLGKGKKVESTQQMPSISTVAADSSANTATPEPELTPLELILSKPITPCPPLEAPPLKYSPRMAVMIAEETGDGSAWAVTYRGLTSTTKEDVHVIEQTAPLWLLDFLLGNRVQLRDPVKISFVLQPWTDAETAGLADLPNANARLNANRNLRIRKVMAYVAGKLELHRPSRAPSISGASQAGSATPEASAQSPVQPNHPVMPHTAPALKLNGATPSHSRGPSEASAHTNHSDVSSKQNAPALDPEHDIEILCGDEILQARMTLAIVRTHFWKSGGDVVLSYRRRRELSSQ